MAKKGFDPKYLEGLTSDFTEKEEVVKDGRKTIRYNPRKRPLTEADLTSWTDYGDRLVFATANGKKYAAIKETGVVTQILAKE